MKTFRVLLIFFIIFFSCKTLGKVTIEDIDALKEKILKYNLIIYAQDDYNETEEIYNEYKELIEAKKNMHAKSTLKLLAKQYNMIFDDTMPLYTQDVNNKIVNIKTLAKEIKANVAVKEKYQEALNTYDEALKQNKEKNFETALDLFNKANEMFNSVYEETKVKKDKTNNSINDVTSEIEELKKAVTEFEKQLTDEQKLDNNKEQPK
ncbi:MAG: hypothetical protein JXB50_03525 [Spirochaetes bacterium]|nr:hypothetical protein [Spirochaetota bacterium]